MGRLRVLKKSFLPAQAFFPLLFSVGSAGYQAKSSIFDDLGARLNHKLCCTVPLSQETADQVEN